MFDYQAQRRCIASIYPGKLERITSYHGPAPQAGKGRATNYELEPVPKGGRPFVIQCRDMFEDVLDQGGNANGMNKIPKPVDVNEIVNHLVRMWSGNIPGVPEGAAPGVMAIANTVPTAAERDRMEVMQKKYFNYWFQLGEQKAKATEFKAISPTMILAAQYLERNGPGQTTHDWGVDIEATIQAALTREKDAQARGMQMTKCPDCYGEIDLRANSCKHCGIRIRPMAPEIAELNQRKTPAPVTPAAKSGPAGPVVPPVAADAKPENKKPSTGQRGPAAHPALESDLSSLQPDLSKLQPQETSV